MGVAISSPTELQAWLEDKPREWAHVIALRAALRVLPFTCVPALGNSQPVDERLVLAVARASGISSGARNIPPDHIAAEAARVAYAAAVFAAPAAAAAAAAAASSARSSAARSSGARGAARAGATYAADAAARAAAADNDAAAAWAALAGDCARLQDGTALAVLLAQPLWIERPDWFQDAWGRAAQWLSRPEHGFAIWREWYFGRLEGLPHAFDRFNVIADEAFYRWLIEQDDDWWKREPATVNSNIAAKVEELRRPAPRSDEEFAQNPTVVNFALDDEGRTVLAPEPLPNGLQDDPDARDTHGEIVRLIAQARLSCDPGRTQAGDMLDPVDLLSEANGQSISDVRPRLFVLRGKELIRQFEDRQREDSLATPLSVGQIDAFAPLIAAVRQLADEDPKLRGLWQGPEGGAPALEKQQITALVDALKAVGQTTPEAQEALTTAAGQVRPDASPADPARRSASEMFRNVFRSIGKQIKWAGDKSQAAIGFYDRMHDLWERIRSVLPVDELIARILDLFK